MRRKSVDTKGVFTSRPDNPVVSSSAASQLPINRPVLRCAETILEVSVTEAAQGGEDVDNLMEDTSRSEGHAHTLSL